jgi:DNA polymerase III alpha subunit (gram-positive type)
MKNKRLFIYDFETNGFWSPLNQPIQVAIKIIEPNGDVKDYMNYIRCDRPLSYTIESLTGITDFVLAEKGIDIKDCFKDVAELLLVENTIICGHNILTFDNLFLNYYLNKFGFKGITKEDCFDTSGELKAKLIGEKKLSSESYGVYHARALSRRVQGVKHKLTDACDYYKIKYDCDNMHNASVDVDCTYKVLLKQLRNKGLEKINPNNPLGFFG